MCTAIGIMTKEGRVMGRTLEWGGPFDSEILFIPRNYNVMKTENGKDVITKYAFIGCNYSKENSVNDGVNEKGLVGSVNYFPGYAKYIELNEMSNEKDSLAPGYILTYLLSKFESVKEIKENIDTFELVSVPAALLGFPVPLHVAVFDKYGDSIVIEPIDGKLKVYDNEVGVMTNSPTFEWHLTNLRNYVGLQRENIDNSKFESWKATKFGQGTGSIGIPGDYTPPARFIRAAYLSSSLVTPETNEDGVVELFHILGSFDIPKGAILDPALNGYDVAIYTAVMDTKNLTYNIHTIKDPTVRRLSLKDMDLNAKEITRYELSTKAEYFPLKKIEE